MRAPKSDTTEGLGEGRHTNSSVAGSPSPDRINVMVRARPLNKRELAAQAMCIMEMGTTWVKLTDPTIASSMSEAHFDSQAKFRAAAMRAAGGKSAARAARRTKAAKSALSTTLEGMNREDRAIFDTTFHFDQCFWSTDGDAPVTQRQIFEAVSPAIFENIASWIA